MDGLSGIYMVEHLLAMACMVVWLLKQLVKGTWDMVEMMLALEERKDTKE